jgi:hypothetical protein
MNRVGNIRMEPATSLTGVRKGNKIIWARGLFVRVAHEGVAHSPGRAQAFGCRNAPYCLLAATAAAASPMTRIAAIMGHGPRLTRRTPARARSGISGTPCVTIMLAGISTGGQIVGLY